MKVTIKRPACMTLERASDLGRRGFWWLRRGAHFVELDPYGVRVPASDPLDVELELEPGEYVLGAGDPSDYRETIEVTKTGLAVAPCIRTGCSGTVPLPLPACDPFASEPPAHRLCEPCRGAS